MDMDTVAQRQLRKKVGVRYMRRIGAPHYRGRQSDGGKLFESAFSVFNSVCVNDMMINNRGTSQIR